MNALTRSAFASLPRAAATAGARAQSTATLGKFTKPTFAQTWLQDPGTYPIIVIIAFSSVGWMGFLGYKMAYCPSVRITSKTRGQVLRTWS